MNFALPVPGLTRDLTAWAKGAGSNPGRDGADGNFPAKRHRAPRRRNPNHTSQRPTDTAHVPGLTRDLTAWGQDHGASADDTKKDCHA